MRSSLDMALHMLEHAYNTMVRNVEGVTLDEALFIPEGGHRSVLGTLKHTAGWSYVYRSYAFDAHPRHWNEIDWPPGLRETIDSSKDYVEDVIEWFKLSHRRWLEDLRSTDEDQLNELRPVHWGQEAPLYHIVAMIAGHHIYHAGELNQVLSIYRGEAWEEGEEVEENNISTIGHRVKPAWLEDEES